MFLALGGVETPAGDMTLAASSLTLGEAAGLVSTDEDSFLEKVLVDLLGSEASSPDRVCLEATFDLVTLLAGSWLPVSEEVEASCSDADWSPLVFSLETLTEEFFLFLETVLVDLLAGGSSWTASLTALVLVVLLTLG